MCAPLAHSITPRPSLRRYVRSVVHLAFSKNSTSSELPYQVTNVLLFFKLFCNFANVPFKALEGFLPTYLFCALTSRT